MSVLRTTTFDLTDGTGDYLEVEVSLAETDGEVEVEEISGVEFFSILLLNGPVELNLLGPTVAYFHDRIIADAESHFADAGAEIRAEEAAS